MRLRLGRFDSFFGWLLSYCIESIAPTTAVRAGSPVLPFCTHTGEATVRIRGDRGLVSRPVFYALFALFGTISALFIAAIEQVRHLAEGLLKLAP